MGLNTDVKSMDAGAAAADFFLKQSVVFWEIKHGNLNYVLLQQHDICYSFVKIFNLFNKVHDFTK